VEAVLDAVVRILKKEGVDAVTTNRVAVVAGVSVGSIYQYFPDKRAIFSALHDRHADAMGRLVESTVVANVSRTLGELVGNLLSGLIDAHSGDQQLYALLMTEVPHGAASAQRLDARLQGAFRLAISSRGRELSRDLDVERCSFVLAHMVESLSHAAALNRPPSLSVAAAKSEALRAVLAYLRS